MNATKPVNRSSSEGASRRHRMRERLELVEQLSQLPGFSVHAQMRGVLRRVTSNFRLIAARMQALGALANSESDVSLDESESSIFASLAGPRPLTR